MAAAFARLCVETILLKIGILICVSSRLRAAVCWNCLCRIPHIQQLKQPPSRGCVLKLQILKKLKITAVAAAFARLCVETVLNTIAPLLCPCSRLRAAVCWNIDPILWMVRNGSSRLRAAVCWNSPLLDLITHFLGSRLRAAVCWNIVLFNTNINPKLQPPSRGCVLKRRLPNIRVQNQAAAAFARLCVETLPEMQQAIYWDAAAFARLCVETEVT